MDVLDLHLHIKQFILDKNMTGEKTKYVLNFADEYIIENKQSEIMVNDLYKLIDIDISYNQFVRALNKRWRLEKLDGGRLKLNTRFPKAR